MVTTSLFENQLAAAREALAQGNFQAVRTAARNGLVAAIACRDKHGQAKASLLLGQALTLESKMHWARQFITGAQALFLEAQDPAGISDCLLTLSYVNSALGRNDSALRSASDVVAGSGGIDRRSAAGLNYYGVASFWTHDYGTAGGVLGAACQLAVEETGNAAATFQPLTNSCFNEVLRVTDSQLKGDRVDGLELARRVFQSKALVREGATGTLMKGSADAGMFLLEFVSCFLATRTGQTAEADTHYLGCLERARMLPPTNWMQALVWWARLERAEDAGEMGEAVASANAMVAVAQKGEHVPLRAFAERLRAANRAAHRANHSFLRG